MKIMRKLSPRSESGRLLKKILNRGAFIVKNHYVKVKSIKHITHDVLQIEVDKPKDFAFKPGQATEISINKLDWTDEKRPFTFTSLPDQNYLQFVIKTYPAHKGVTNELLQLKKGDELILHDVFGTITYHGEGIFIAGGAGVTPFIAILRDLQSRHEIGNNKLIFANKTRADIILKDEFEEILGTNFINTLSNENAKGYLHGRISEELLKGNITDLNKRVYICGPDPMMDALGKILANLGVDKKLIVKEVF